MSAVSAVPAVRTRWCTCSVELAAGARQRGGRGPRHRHRGAARRGREDLPDRIGRDAGPSAQRPERRQRAGRRLRGRAGRRAPPRSSRLDPCGVPAARRRRRGGRRHQRHDRDRGGRPTCWNSSSKSGCSASEHVDAGRHLGRRKRLGDHRSERRRRRRTRPSLGRRRWWRWSAGPTSASRRW